MRRRAGILYAAPLMMAACAAPGAPPVCSVRAAPAPDDGERVPVAWMDVGEAQMPGVHAWVGGERLTLLADTGANVHFMDRGAAWALGLAPRELEAATTASGVRVVLHDGVLVRGVGPEAVSAAYVELDDVRVGLRSVRPTGAWVTLEAYALAQVGLAGVLSPQLASPDEGALELDLRASSLRVLDRASAARALAPAPGFTPLRSLGVGPLGAAMFAVDAEIDGAPVRLLVDTGASAHSVALRSALGARLAARPSTARSLSVSVDGERETALARGVPVAVAGWRGEGLVRLDDDTRSEPGLDGTLGIGALRHCTIVIARDAGALRCGS